MDSQETVGISPDMFEEFIFPCYQKIASQFGLLSYGCCEPVHPIWERCLSKLPNLRKISISPWCDEEYMGEQLRGSHVIYHRKPSPNFLGVDEILDEDAFRAHIRRSLTAAAGCEMEITQRDVYTIITISTRRTAILRSSKRKSPTAGKNNRPFAKRRNHRERMTIQKGNRMMQQTFYNHKSLLKNGKPWFPVMGEFTFPAIPQNAGSRKSVK